MGVILYMLRYRAARTSLHYSDFAFSVNDVFCYVNSLFLTIYREKNASSVCIKIRTRRSCSFIFSFQEEIEAKKQVFFYWLLFNSIEREKQLSMCAMVVFLQTE
jgi:hypothetical protein